MTVTLGAPKVPLILPPAEQKSGEVVIADIGIPAEVFETLDGPRARAADARPHPAADQRRAPPTRTRAISAAC